MKEQKNSERQEAGCFAAIVGEVLLLVGQFLVVPIFVVYFLVCFWLFDRFHVSNSDTQLAFVLAPIVMGGVFIAFHLIRKSWEGE